MKDRNRSIALVLSLMSLFGALPGQADEPLPVVRVGIVFDGPWPGNETILALTRTEIVALTERDFDVRFPAAEQRVGDWTFDGARAAVESLLADAEVDLVIAWGVLASQAAGRTAAPEKPVIAPLILDIGLQSIPYDAGVSGVANLSYVTFQDNTAEELSIFRDIVPFDKLTFLAQRGIIDAIPELTERTRELVEGLGIEASYVPIDVSVDEALAAIPDDTEAVYVWPQFQLARGEVERLVAGLEARRLPTFSALADDAFEAGILATLAAEDFFPRLARRVALNTQSILLGIEAGHLPVAFAVRGRLTINLATAQAIGVSPRWELLIEADLIGAESIDGLQPVDFDQTVREAVEVNLDVLAQQRLVAAGAQDPVRARAALRPRVDLSASGVGIDDDRAGVGQAERTFTGRLALSQVVFDDQVRANIAIQDQLQTGREAELEQVRLDIALDAATAYLNLLRAVSLAEVQRSNLTLTRSNLERAELRRSVGAANPAEVFRWQSQIANDRRALIDAMASIQQAEIALSRLLDRDLGTRYRAAAIDLEDPLLVTGETRFDGYIETPRHFHTLSNFMVSEGTVIAPEIIRLRTSIAAQ
ncbi:MAG: TolC family protein, partial [Acidobacteriota bacterium]